MDKYNNSYTIAQQGSDVYKDFLRSQQGIDWSAVNNKSTNACKEEPLRNADDAKVKLDFTKLLGETKFSLNQNN